MNINTFLDLVCNEIKYKPIRNDIAEELKNHINEIKQEYIDKGLESNKAEDKAVEQMGNPKEIGLKLNKIHKPKLDWKLLIIMIITLGFSLLVTFTRASNISQNNEIDVMIKYIAFMVIGIILSVICYFVDYRKLLKHSNKLFIIASLSIIVSITFGTNLRGVSHFRIGTYMFSPSVIAMPLYILSFVGFLENINKENKAYKEMSMNVVANLLGLGNAATPLGLKAIKTLQEENSNKEELSDSMIMFIVLNTISIQLIPTTVIAIRSSLRFEQSFYNYIACLDSYDYRSYSRNNICKNII